jgi:hypothetical protein
MDPVHSGTDQDHCGCIAQFDRHALRLEGVKQSASDLLTLSFSHPYKANKTVVAHSFKIDSLALPHRERPALAAINFRRSRAQNSMK